MSQRKHLSVIANFSKIIEIIATNNFPVAQMIKNLLAMPETQVRYPGGEDPLEKGMAIHSSTLAWRIPWTENPGGLQSLGSQNWTLLTLLSRLNSIS